MDLEDSDWIEAEEEFESLISTGYVDAFVCGCARVELRIGLLRYVGRLLVARYI